MICSNLVHSVGAGGFGMEIVFLIMNHCPTFDYLLFDNCVTGQNIKTIETFVFKRDMVGDCILAIGQAKVQAFNCSV